MYQNVRERAADSRQCDVEEQSRTEQNMSQAQGECMYVCVCVSVSVSVCVCVVRSDISEEIATCMKVQVLPSIIRSQGL